MGFAAALPAIGAGLGAFGAFQQMRAARASADYNARLSEYNSQVAATNAKQEAMDATEASAALQRRLANKRREDARFLAAQRASFARAGVASAGTPLLVEGETAQNLEDENLEIAREGGYDLRNREIRRQESLRDAFMSLSDAGVYRSQGRAARTAGFLNVGTSLLAGVNEMSRNRYRIQNAHTMGQERVRRAEALGRARIRRASY